MKTIFLSVKGAEVDKWTVTCPGVKTDDNFSTGSSFILELLKLQKGSYLLL